MNGNGKRESRPVFRSLLIGLSLILLVSSCSAITGQVEQPKPPPIVRPNLESAWPNDKGGICLDRQDTIELLHYLDRLEAVNE